MYVCVCIHTFFFFATLAYAFNNEDKLISSTEIFKHSRNNLQPVLPMDGKTTTYLVLCPAACPHLDDDCLQDRTLPPSMSVPSSPPQCLAQS